MVAVSAKILYSLFVKGTTITPLLKKFKVVKKTDLEQFEQCQSELMIYNQILDKIEFMKQHYHLPEDNYRHLKDLFTSKLSKTKENIGTFIQKHKTPILLSSRLSLWRRWE